MPVVLIEDDAGSGAAPAGRFAAMRRRAGIVTHRRAALAAIALAALALGGYLGLLQLSGNFHTVIAGQLYRSAQPTAGQLETYVREHGIRTVVNLRGESRNARWYQDETAASTRLNLTHIDFRMNASRRLSTQEADRLVAILRTVPKPILIHCKAGADRTGLVSVIYSERIAGIGEDRAENQLSIRFGHIGVPFLSSTFAMDESWETLERHFGIAG